MVFLQARAKGQCYTASNGEKVAARTTGPDCRCSKKCFKIVDEDLRYHILTTFNQLGNSKDQNFLLRGLIVGKDVARRGKQGRGGVAKKGNMPKTKESTYEYFVPGDHNRRIPVCLKAFQSIFGITYRRVRTVRRAAIPVDNRGKHPKKKTAGLLVERVKAHILSFPRMTSHYSRQKNPRRRYLNPGLSVNRMYLMYLEKHEPEVWRRKQQGLQVRQENVGLREVVCPKPQVSLDTYRRIFQTSFNLSFGLPRSDTCATCDAFKISVTSTTDEEEKAALQKKLHDHHKEAETGYKSVRADKEAAKSSWEGKTRKRGGVPFCTKDAVDMITFDFQQNLPVPNLTHGDMFYQRQLWMYNFGVHDCVSEQGVMFMWPETTAKRGSSEVTSCLMKNIQKYATGAKSLQSYSDNSVGQNKNIALIGLYSHLHDTKVYDSIDHKFMYKGHSFLPNDRFVQVSDITHKRNKTNTRQ